MLINLSIGCEKNRETGESECSLLLQSIVGFRDRLELDGDPKIYGDATETVICQLDIITNAINYAMLKALESLEPLQVVETTTNYKTVYEVRTTGSEGREV